MSDKKNSANFEKIIIQKITKAISSIDGISNVIKVGIDKEKDMYIIGVKLRVYYGVNIPTISYDVQSLGKNSLLQEELDLVKSINISVEGIDEQVK